MDRSCLGPVCWKLTGWKKTKHGPSCFIFSDLWVALDPSGYTKCTSRMHSSGSICCRRCYIYMLVGCRIVRDFGGSRHGLCFVLIVVVFRRLRIRRTPRPHDDLIAMISTAMCFFFKLIYGNLRGRLWARRRLLSSPHIQLRCHHVIGCVRLGAFCLRARVCQAFGPSRGATIFGPVAAEICVMP